MKSLARFKWIGISVLLVVGLSACEKPGPAESAGEKMDRTVDEAGNKIDEAADKIGEKLSEQGKKTGATLEDAEITAKVKAAIFAESGLKTLKISVETVNGVVTLSGSADSLQSSEKAKSLAAAVAGVNAVENQLVQQ